MSNVRSIKLSGTKNFYRTGNYATDPRKASVGCWFKRSAIGTVQSFLLAGNVPVLYFNAANHLCSSYGSEYSIVSVETVTDTEFWHHVLIAYDTTKTGAPVNRSRMYLDGVEVNYGSSTFPLQDAYVINSTSDGWHIGTNHAGNNFQGWLDEFYFIDSGNAQITPDRLITGTPGAPTDYTGAYGPRGLHLSFDNYASVNNLGFDTSGNALNFTPRNIVLADSSTDIPQQINEALDLTVAVPTLGTPALQAFALVAVDLDGGSPVTDTPELTVIPVNTVHAVDLSNSNPELGMPVCLAFRSGSLGAGWTLTSTRIGLDFLDSTGAWDAAALLETVAAGPFEISQTISKPAVQQIFRVAFAVAPTPSRRLVEIGLSDDAGNVASAIFDPLNGECRKRTSSIGFHLLGIEADPIRFGYYRFMVVAETNDATILKAFIRLCNDSLATDYVSDGTGSVRISDPMLLEGTDSRSFRWEIGPPEMRFYWTVHLTSLGLRWFRCGQGVCGVDPHLAIINAPDLDCVLRRWQPAQDQLVFDYSGMVVAGSGDPMAGTP